jgi:hypothetical protein
MSSFADYLDRAARADRMAAEARFEEVRYAYREIARPWSDLAYRLVTGANPPRA